MLIHYICCNAICENLLFFVLTMGGSSFCQYFAILFVFVFVAVTVSTAYFSHLLPIHWSHSAISRPCHLLELYPNRDSLKITFPMSGISTENLYVFPSWNESVPVPVGRRTILVLSSFSPHSWRYSLMCGSRTLPRWTETVYPLSKIKVNFKNVRWKLKFWEFF